MEPGKGVDHGDGSGHEDDDAGDDHDGGQSGHLRLTESEDDRGQGQHDGDDADVLVLVDERSTDEPREGHAEQVVDREGALRIEPAPAGVPDRPGDELETGEQEGGAEEGPGDEGDHQVAERFHNRADPTGLLGPHGEEGEREDNQCSDQKDERVGLTGVDGKGKGHAEQGDVPDLVPAADDEDDGREQPTGPGEHRRNRPPQPYEEGATQFEHRSGQGAGDDAEAQHPAQDVGAGTGDEERRHDLDGVHQPDREEIADQIRKAEDRRLPVERQGHPQRAVGIPQRQLAVVDLGPGKCGPGDHLVDLVTTESVVHQHAGLQEESVTREPVVLTERQAVVQGREHDRDCRGQHPAHTDQVADPGMRTATSMARRRRHAFNGSHWFVVIRQAAHTRSIVQKHDCNCPKSRAATGPDVGPRRTGAGR